MSSVRINGPADAPPVLFIHSLGTDLTIWDGVVEALGPAVRSIRYDLRGHGGTPPTDGPYSVAALADDAISVLLEMKVTQATICGISVGGLIALQCAAHRPTLAQTLVVCDTPYPRGAPAMWNQRIDAVNAHGLASIADATMPRWFSSDFRSRFPDDVSRYRQVLERTTPAGYVGTCAAIRDADAEAIASGVHCPTLVLCGSEDAATPPETNEALARALRNARFARIDGAAHLPCVESPAVVAGHIAAFVMERAHVR
jgi:3-oxoadipate enol-lactonase